MKWSSFLRLIAAACLTATTIASTLAAGVSTGGTAKPSDRPDSAALPGGQPVGVPPPTLLLGSHVPDVGKRSVGSQGPGS